jgi:hypothetical protein
MAERDYLSAAAFININRKSKFILLSLRYTLNKTRPDTDPRDIISLLKLLRYNLNIVLGIKHLFQKGV